MRAELARAVVESNWKLYELRTSGLSLEDIFLKLTTKDLSEENKKSESRNQKRKANRQGRLLSA